MPDLDVTLPLDVVKYDEQTLVIEDNGVRCLLFVGSERALLVDTGFGNAGSLKELVLSLTDKPLMVLISHADPDHLGCASEFGSIHIHPNDIDRFRGFSSADVQINAIGDGEVIDIGGRSFEVVLIPGHTLGSIALLDRGNRLLVVGDSVSAGPVFMFGEGRSFDAYMASMERLIALKGEFDDIFPSHGPLPIPAGQIDKALAAAKKLLAGELSPQEPPFPLPAKMYMHEGAGFFC